MKITIDTQKDTHEDIKKVLHILTHMLDKRDSITSKSESVDTAPMMSMFSDPEPKQESTSNASTSTTETKDTAPDFSSFLNLTKKEEEKKDEEPQVQFF